MDKSYPTSTYSYKANYNSLVIESLLILIATVSENVIRDSNKAFDNNIHIRHALS